MAELEDEAELIRVVTAESGMPIVTKFLILAECIDAEGDRVLMNLSSEHCGQWDQLGFMEFHRQSLLAQRDE